MGWPQKEQALRYNTEAQPYKSGDADVAMYAQFTHLPAQLHLSQISVQASCSPPSSDSQWGCVGFTSPADGEAASREGYGGHSSKNTSRSNSKSWSEHRGETSSLWEGLHEHNPRHTIMVQPWLPWAMWASPPPWEDSTEPPTREGVDFQMEECRVLHQPAAFMCCLI